MDAPSYAVANLVVLGYELLDLIVAALDAGALIKQRDDVIAGVDDPA